MEAFGIFFIVLIALIIQGYFLRNAFQVHKQLKNQETQILLLTRIAQKVGVEPEKIQDIIKHL